MFLQAMIVKGFKSFAETARLDLEPGITVVVGPNGSGKSNVVDAMAWVLGAQAPTAVRSQKMDDVIFAGTATRKPLGRAEVALTIDNTDGQLPVEFNEVTIKRTLFRSGDSDYAINGVSCRLLDIQELLSDSGVGRQQHIIVSQGRIDDVLNAKPEDRRQVIEEAAGVLKYRKRKERAERRLAATEENLQRLQDLLREVRRQVKPLEKQAEAARRHGTLVAELTVLKIHLAGRELRALTQQSEGLHRQRLACDEREGQLATLLATLDATVLEAESELAALGSSDIADVASRARSLRERIRGQDNVVTERRRRLEGELQAAVDDGLVASLEAESAGLDADLRSTEREQRVLRPRFTELEQSESRLKAEQLTFDTEWGDGLAPKPTKAPEMRAQLQALDEAGRRTATELDRIDTELTEMATRTARITGERDTALATVTRLGTLDQPGTELAQLTEAKREALTTRDTADQARSAGMEQRRRADAEANRWQARADALRQALDDARSRAGASALDGTRGVLGTLLDLVAIDDGWELAVEAAVGEALQAVVVDNQTNAAVALAALETQDLAGAVLALGPHVQPPLSGPPPAGSSPLRQRVRSAGHSGAGSGGWAPSLIEPLLDLLIGSAVVVDGSWRQAMDLALAHPGVVAVTKAGDRFGPRGWRVGLSGTGATGAALEEAESQAAFARAEAADAATKLKEAEAAASAASRTAREATDKLSAAESERDRASQAADRASSQLDQFVADEQRLQARRQETIDRRQADETDAEKLRIELPAVENEEAEYLNRVEALSQSRTSLEERARAVAKTRSDLEVEAAGIDQRRNLLIGRQAEIDERLVRLGAEREQARVRRIAIEAALEEVAAMADRLAAKTTVVAAWIEAIDTEQQAQSEAARQVAEMLSARRNERSGAEKDLMEVRERRSRIELEHTERRVKLEALTEAVRRELNTDPEMAMATPLPAAETDASPEARVRDLERELKLLGPINPLALEEFETLKERYEFLDGQVNDVKATRRDLNTLIRSIDEEIVSVFSAAYADVATNFINLFTNLFPGGQGGLRLTNPDDLLSCGIEIEAKPSGKNVKKLSLLSGGERSLVALAFLFAVFRSRPSPFYVLDEVEAALDDVNLSRFLGLVDEFRKEAQLIIVSHQKRTMEAADVLYGVSMKPGGSSKVVSQKVEGRRTDEPTDPDSPDDDDGLAEPAA